MSIFPYIDDIFHVQDSVILEYRTMWSSSVTYSKGFLWYKPSQILSFNHLGSILNTLPGVVMPITEKMQKITQIAQQLLLDVSYAPAQQSACHTIVPMCLLRLMWSHLSRNFKRRPDSPAKPILLNVLEVVEAIQLWSDPETVALGYATQGHM